MSLTEELLHQGSPPKEGVMREKEAGRDGQRLEGEELEEKKPSSTQFPKLDHKIHFVIPLTWLLPSTDQCSLCFITSLTLGKERSEP